jgi:hypothetical protein
MPALKYCRLRSGNSRAYNPAVKHACWAVTCKTPKCRVIVAKYIGEHDSRPVYTLPSDIPGWFHLKCRTCGKEHRYTRDDFRVTGLDSAPPADFQPCW